MKLQQGMTALVTGGVSGLGEASAIALLERGLNVVAVDLNDERGRAMRSWFRGRLAIMAWRSWPGATALASNRQFCRIQRHCMV